MQLHPYSLNFYKHKVGNDNSFEKIHNKDDIEENSALLISMNYEGKEFCVGDIYYLESKFYIISFVKGDLEANNFGFFELKNENGILTFHYGTGTFKKDLIFLTNKKCYYIGNIFIHDVNAIMKDDFETIKIDTKSLLTKNSSQKDYIYENSRLTINFMHNNKESEVIFNPFNKSNNLFYLHTRFDKLYNQPFTVSYEQPVHVMTFDKELPTQVFFNINYIELGALYKSKLSKEECAKYERYKSEVYRYSKKSQIVLSNFFVILNEKNQLCYVDVETSKIYLHDNYNLIVPIENYTRCIDFDSNEFSKYYLQVI